MEFEELKKFAKQFVRVWFKTNSNREVSIEGVLLYSNKGITIYDGSGYRDFEGTEHNNFLDIYKENKVIPYEKVTYISDKTYGENKVEDYMKMNYNVDYNKMLNVLCVDFYKDSVFNTVPDNIKIINLLDYPHKCPLCGGPAFICLFNVDCSCCNGELYGP